MSDPVEFIDAEVLKAKLSEIQATLARLEGKLEVLLTALGEGEQCSD